MALSSGQIQDGRQEKGKAVYILHTWKDHLWDMGSKPDPPEFAPFLEESEPAPGSSLSQDDAEASPPPSEDIDVPDETPIATARVSYTPSEISTMLHESLLQALSTVLSELPSSSFPMSASIFYSTYVLPYRPAFPNSVFPNGSETSSLQEITIKTSAHKSLTAFLKSAEKASLLTLRAPPKHGQQSEVVVTGVNASHPSVVGHKRFVTVKDIETAAAKKALREERLNEAEEKNGQVVEVKEVWRPHLKSVELFEAFGERQIS